MTYASQAEQANSRVDALQTWTFASNACIVLAVQKLTRSHENHGT